MAERRTGILFLLFHTLRIMRPLVSGALCALLLTLLAFPRSVAAQQKLERGDVTVNVGGGAVLLVEPLVFSRTYNDGPGVTVGAGYALYPWLEIWTSGALSRHTLDADQIGIALGGFGGVSEVQGDRTWIGSGRIGARFLLYPTSRVTMYTSLGVGATHQQYGAASLVVTSTVRDPRTGLVIGDIVDQLATSTESQTNFGFTPGLGARVNLDGRFGVFGEVSYGIVLSKRNFVYEVENLSAPPPEALPEDVSVEDGSFTPPNQDRSTIQVPRVLAGIYYRF